jgi:multidrug efflux pump
MGRFIELFVRRPVLAIVVSLVILLLGLRSLQTLNVRQYPESSTAVVTITTPYAGANAELVRGFVTAPLEQAIASANGIDFLDSSSAQGVSTIRAHLELNYDPNAAVAQILTKINQVRNQLPPDSENPIVTVSVGEFTASMYLAFASEVLAPHQVTDYLVRVVRPQLESIDGVQQAQIIGAQEIAMRIWLDPQRLTAHHVTATDVRQALATNNFLSAIGDTRGTMLSINLEANTALHSVEGFERLVVRKEGNAVIRLRDVATVALGAVSYETSVYFNGTPAVFMAIEVVPTENVLDVIGRVRTILPDIQRQLPQGIEGQAVYDATVFIEQSIEEVITNLVQALVIVTVVIFLFLGSLRAALVPAVAMPLSLIGAAFIMLVLGYSLNLLTLLALVLAIGTVVDDGIVVVENVSRHVEAGAAPLAASIASARELTAPIIAMNIVVLAVYAPVAFLPGLTGTLFTEFAYTVAGATLISGIVVLTLSPMMCSKLLRRGQHQTRLARWVERGFVVTARVYEAMLRYALDVRWVVLALGAAILVSCYFLYISTESELAPQEDQGFLVLLASADPNVSLDQLERWTSELEQVTQDVEATRFSFTVNGFGGSSQAFGGMALRPWQERDKTTMEIAPEVQQRVNGIAGLQTAVFAPPTLPGAGGGPPVELVIGSTADPLVVFEAAQALLAEARQSGQFLYIDTDLKFDQLQVAVDIDRAKAADLGIDMASLGQNLSTLLAAGYVNFFSAAGRSYRVIPQVERQFRLTPEQLTQYHVRTESGALIPLSTIVRLRDTVQPRQLVRFNQLNAATISGVPAPGITLGTAIATLERLAADTLPSGFVTNWAGQSRQFFAERTTLVTGFVLAVLLMYLVLAAQFESFRAPAIMLVSVPMSLAGALLCMALGVVTLNIYTQIGLLALVASIIRHGILLVEFANQVQHRDHVDRRHAIEIAAAQRLRPILMTTIATLFGMVPLWFAGGPGAESRFAIGFVLGAGMAIGTVFTLFVVPALYTVIAKAHHGRAPADTVAATSSTGI